MKIYKVKLKKGRTIVYEQYIEAEAGYKAAEMVKQEGLSRSLSFDEIIVTDLIRKKTL